MSETGGHTSARSTLIAAGTSEGDRQFQFCAITDDFHDSGLLLSGTSPRQIAR